MFIKRLELTSDVDQICSELDKILVHINGWKKNQIGLKSRVNAVARWADSVGSLYDGITGKPVAKESDFTEWNLDSDSYIRNQIEILENLHNFKSGRARLMRLSPHCGLSVHRDNEVRYHLVLKTNPFSYVAHNLDEPITDCDLKGSSICYHIPRDGVWYLVDTRNTHWVYNGGNEERIHLVICGENK